MSVRNLAIAMMAIGGIVTTWQVHDLQQEVSEHRKVDIQMVKVEESP